jgi:LemA protein
MGLALFLAGWIVGLAVGAALAVAAAALMMYFASLYRSLLASKNKLGRSFSDIDTLLKRRHDELPKLIETCKGYMPREQKILQDLGEARASFARAATAAGRAQAEGAEARALEILLAAAEKQPGLKTDSNFLELRGRIRELGARIVAERQAYHDEAHAFNARIAKAPASLVAKLAGLEPRALVPAAAGEQIATLPAGKQTR